MSYYRINFKKLYDNIGILDIDYKNEDIGVIHSYKISLSNDDIIYLKNLQYENYELLTKSNMFKLDINDNLSIRINNVNIIKLKNQFMIRDFISSILDNY